MATPAQISSNRANAQHSTGPRSVEGKAASSRNSLKLGIYSQSLIIAGEDPEALAELTLSCEEHFQPAGPIEIGLVQTIVRSQWLKLRYARIETEILNARMAAQPEGTEHPLGAVMIQDAANGDTLHKLFRRQQAAERDWYKAIETLSRLQSSRRSAEAPSAPATNATISNRVRFDEALEDPLSDMRGMLTELETKAQGASKPAVNLALRL